MINLEEVKIKNFCSLKLIDINDNHFTPSYDCGLTGLSWADLLLHMMLVGVESFKGYLG